MPTLAEQVAALEADRDEWRTAWEGVNTHRNQLRDALAAAESRLASARVEGAREQRDAFVAGAVWRERVIPAIPTGRDMHSEAARRYPAPSAHAGEAMDKERCAYCQATGDAHDARCDRPDIPACDVEPLVFSVEMSRKNDGGVEWFDGGVWERITLTPADCRRIVALGSRPTQTAEG